MLSPDLKSCPSVRTRSGKFYAAMENLQSVSPACDVADIHARFARDASAFDAATSG
jgi:hypothetical protein